MGLVHGRKILWVSTDAGKAGCYGGQVTSNSANTCVLAMSSSGDVDDDEECESSMVPLPSYRRPRRKAQEISHHKATKIKPKVYSTVAATHSHIGYKHLHVLVGSV